MAGLTLTELRFNAGLTPEALAAEVETTGRTIRRIEAGQRPSPALAKRLADFFDVKPSDLWPLPEKAYP